MNLETSNLEPVHIESRWNPLLKQEMTCALNTQLLFVKRNLEFSECTIRVLLSKSVLREAIQHLFKSLLDIGNTGCLAG